MKDQHGNKITEHEFTKDIGDRTEKQIQEVCARCGVSANVLTCLKKYKAPPKRLAFDVSTFHEGKCDFCGANTMVTEVRDYFYPDFDLLTKACK